MEHSKSHNLYAYSTSNVTTEPCEQILWADLICWSHAISKNSLFAWFYLNSYERIATPFLFGLTIIIILPHSEVIWKHEGVTHACFRTKLATHHTPFILIASKDEKLLFLMQVYSIINSKFTYTCKSGIVLLNYTFH